MYASRTMTRRNLGEIAARSWRLLASPPQLALTTEKPPLAYALDNGAWTSYQRGEPFDGDLYRRALDLWGDGADWIALPDVVMGGRKSFDLSLSWLARLRGLARPLLLVVQDGMTSDNEGAEITRLGIAGIFVGGSTAWKESSLPMWGQWARTTGKHLHVGRVNTARRIRLCLDAGATSADGTSVTRYAATAAKLDTAARSQQQTLPLISPPALNGS
jgi:hypothetical protein